MADANDAAEQLKLLTDLNQSDRQLTNYRQAVTQEFQSQQIAQLKASQLSASQQKEVNERNEAQQTAINDGNAFLNQAYGKLELTQPQAFASRLSGELGATIAYQLGQDYNKEATRNGSDSKKAQALAAALAQLDQEETAFRAQNPDALHYINDVSEDRAKDLSSPDGFMGNVVKGAATAVAGIPGLAGIAASAVGLEGTGQVLGGLAAGIRDAAPTDIGSSAASQQFADIMARAEAGELSTTDAIRQGLSLGLSDGDFAADLLANTVGAAVGGGAVRGVASGAARIAGREAAQTGAQAGGRTVLGEAANIAPAVGVGLGAGVDENLTTGQARILAGTGAASALTGGITGALGGQVAESALGSLGRQINPRIANAVNPTDDLAQAGIGGQIGAGARSALGTGTAEAGQEFVEGAGESLGQFAQENNLGALATLGNEDARSRAVTSGAVQAPLGAGLGGAIGAPVGVAQVRQQNTVNNEALGQLQTEAIAENNQINRNQAIQAGVDQATGAIESQQVFAPQLIATPDVLEVPGQAESAEVLAAREEAVESRRAELVTQRPLTPEELAAIPLRDRATQGGVNQEPYALQNLYAEIGDIEGSLLPLISQDPSELETTLRALYRNQVAVNPQDAAPESEDAFINNLDINALQSVAGTDESIVAQVRQSLDSAFQAAIDSPSVALDAVQVGNEIQAQREAGEANRAQVEQARISSLESASGQLDDAQTQAVADQMADISAQLREGRISAEQARVQTLDILGNTTEVNPEPSTTPEPITEVTPIDSQPEVEPITDPIETEGISTAAIIDNTPDGAVISESGRVRLTELSSASSPLFQSLDPGDRQSILGSKKGGEARKRIASLLNAQPPLTAPEAGQLREAVNYLEGEIARKKPVTPAEGEASQPTFTPDPKNPQTSTPEFSEFFNGSQLVTPEGTPQVLYTGVIDTEQLIEGAEGRFNTRRSGAFFTSDEAIARRYASGENASSEPAFDAEESVQTVYLNLKNPLVIDAQGGSHLDILGISTGATSDLLTAASDGQPVTTGQVKSLAQPLGYDGAIIKNVDDIGGIQDQYIAFEPTQIKSTTDNSGQFDTSDPNFRSSRIAPPNPSFRQSPGFVGADRAPLSTGLLPDIDSGAQPRRFTTDTVQESINRITSGFKKNPDIQIFPTTESLPDGIRPTDGSRVAGRTNGKTVYIVADGITSEAQLQSVLEEELFHRGIRNSLGGNYDPQLKKIFTQRGGVDGLLQLAGQGGLGATFVSNYQDVIAAAQAGDSDAQIELTDEILARVAQSPNLPSGVKANIKTIAAKIKRYLKQFFPESWFDTVSDNDLLLIMREATTAGREPGQESTTLRSSRVRPGDYRGTNANGEQVIFNYLDNTERSETSFRQDNLTAANNYWKSISSKTRADGLGQTIYRSTPWQGLQKRLSDARISLARVENEFKQLTDGDVNNIFQEVTELDLPPLLRGIVSNLNPSLQKSVMSLHSAVSTYSAQADYAAKNDVIQNVNGKSGTLFQFMSEINDAYRTYGDALGLKPTAAKQSISRYLNARHAQERNDIAWIKSGPMDSEGEPQRKALFAQVSKGTLSMREALDQAEALMEEFGQGDRADFKGAGMTDAEAQTILNQMTADPAAKSALESAAEATYDVIAATNEIKKQTGSYSNSFQEAIEAYGWTNYVPLRGKGADLDDSDDAFISHYADNVFASTYRPFQGRESLTEDVFENVQQIAVSAMEQKAAQPFISKVAVHAVAADQTSAYQTGFDKDGFNGRLLAGKVRQVEINSPEFKALMASKDQKRLVYYNPSNATEALQTALVIDLEDSKGSDAVLGAKSVGADRLDNLLRESFTVNGVGIADVTQTTASLKTWRNLPFIPFDALRNTLTLGYVAATEGGYEGFQKYVRSFTEPGLGNYGRDIFRYTQLYGQNKFDEIAQLVQAEGPNSTIAELDEFFRLGGPTTQLAALRDTPPGSIESLTKFGGIGDKKVLKKADSLLVPLNAAADTLSRFAFYKSLQDLGVPKDVAAGRAKNTANFEQRGTWSGPLGAAFEFARATSVGASALINSTLTGEYGKETAAAAFGAGVMMYTVASMFAGVDDEGDDNQGKVNGKLLNSNFVMQYGDDTSQRIQFGIGFGPIAAAMSAGMQAARFGLGHQGLGDTFENITAGTSKMYEVLPSSGISPVTDPIAFAANTAVPSILKPLYEVSTNMTGLGIPVRSDYPGADSGDLTDSFEGRYNSEQEMYETITQALSNGGVAELNPDNLRHIMRSYGGTMTHLLESAFENVKYVTSDEDYAYNKKAAFYPLRNFIGSEFSQTPSDFYEHYGRIAGLDKRAKGLQARGEVDKANAIIDSDFYADNIDAYKDAKKQLLAINKEHKDVFRLGTTSLAQKRNTQETRDAQRNAVFTDYLDRIRN